MLHEYSIIFYPIYIVYPSPSVKVSRRSEIQHHPHPTNLPTSVTYTRRKHSISSIYHQITCPPPQRIKEKKDKEDPHTALFKPKKRKKERKGNKTKNQEPIQSIEKHSHSLPCRVYKTKKK